VETITGHAKAIAAVLAAVLAAAVPAIAVDGPLTFTDWINVVILAAGAIHVYNAENTPAWQYGKLIAAVISAAAVVAIAIPAWPPTRAEWIQVFIAALGAFTVYRIPNAPAVTSTGRHQKVE
jgi:hypothetical protein